MKVKEKSIKNIHHAYLLIKIVCKNKELRI
jgi:hypothetical protein